MKDERWIENRSKGTRELRERGGKRGGREKIGLKKLEEWISEQKNFLFIIEHATFIIGLLFSPLAFCSYQGPGLLELQDL